MTREPLLDAVQMVARELERAQAENGELRAEVERLTALLQYVLEDEPNLAPRASSSCRAFIRAALVPKP